MGFGERFWALKLEKKNIIRLLGVINGEKIGKNTENIQGLLINPVALKIIYQIFVKRHLSSFAKYLLNFKTIIAIFQGAYSAPEGCLANIW